MKKVVVAGIAIVVAAMLGVGAPAGAQSGSTPAEAEPIKVAFLYPDLSKLKGTGFVIEAGDTAAQAKAYVDALNARDGINGRPVELSLHSYDVLASDLLAEQRAACLAATEDEKAMVVLSPSIFDDPILCVTRQHKTPLIVQNGTSTELVDSSRGRLFTTNFIWDNALRSGVQAFGKSLKGKTIGIVRLDEAGLADDVENGLSKPLEAKGMEVAEEVVLPGLGGSETTAAIPAAIERLRIAGVDALFIASNSYVTSIFLTQAAQAGYEPTYLATDFAEASTNLLARLSPPGAMSDAQGVSWRSTGDAEVGDPPAAFDQECMQTYVARSGETAPQYGDDEYSAVVATCALFNLFDLAATAAGENLNPSSFVRSLRRLQEFDLGGGAKGSFGPKRFDAPNAIRNLKIEESCTAPGGRGKPCWVPAGDFVPFKR